VSERGVFAVDRGVFDHPKFSDGKPLTKLEAWLWLLSAAAWKPISRHISGRGIDLRRGQLAASTRFMADRWRWTEPRVRRFLTLLKNDADGDAQIDTQTDAGITVITIRKYDRYQRVSLPIDALADATTNAAAGAEATHDRRKEEDTKDTKGSEAKASFWRVGTGLHRRATSALGRGRCDTRQPRGEGSTLAPNGGLVAKADVRRRRSSSGRHSACAQSLRPWTGGMDYAGSQQRWRQWQTKLQR
jgi:hypothetical protein